mgnify:CR=1 FL=1
MKITSTYISLYLLLSLIFPISVLAGTSIITNNVSVSANTGGNSARNGETIEGNSSVSVQSKTVINGEVVSEINETREGASDVSLEVTTEASAIEDEIVSESSVVTKDADGNIVAVEESTNLEAEPPKKTIFAKIKALFKYVFSIFTT